MSTNDPARPNSRRGFLRSLASLPLIGGGVTLLGNPTQAAEPVTPALLDSYNAWLIQERQHLLYEMFGSSKQDFYNPNTPGGMYHWTAFGDPLPPQPSTRAAVVLAAVGCDWREGGR